MNSSEDKQLDNVYVDMLSPANLAKNLKALGLLPQHATEAWFTSYDAGYSPDDIVTEEEIVFVKRIKP